MYSMLPNSRYFAELKRPWKLASLAVGMAWLLYGAATYGMSDWDIGISVIMGGLTYLCAPWSVQVIFNAVQYRPRGWPLHIAASIIPAMVTVDWVYWLYHSAMGNVMFRLENFKVSFALYFICGLLWYYKGSLRGLITIIKRRH